MKRRSKKKSFWVVAYDVSDNLRRSRVVKVIEKVGIRVNYSVFECMLTDKQLEKLQAEIANLMLPSEDTVIFYPLCLDCFSKIVYLPGRRERPQVVTVV